MVSSLCWSAEEKLKACEEIPDKDTVFETVKDQEVTTEEVVSNDAEASEEVFDEDLETLELDLESEVED